MQTARQCLAVVPHGNPCGTIEMLLCRGRDRNRSVGQRGQIADHIGALAVLLNAGEAHCGAGDETLRIGDELVEVVEGPGAALALHGCREIKAAASLATVVVDDAIEIWADAVRTTLLEGVAGGALLGRGCALLDGGGLQQL